MTESKEYEHVTPVTRVIEELVKAGKSTIFSLEMIPEFAMVSGFSSGEFRLVSLVSGTEFHIDFTLAGPYDVDLAYEKLEEMTAIPLMRPHRESIKPDKTMRTFARRMHLGQESKVDYLGCKAAARVICTILSAFASKSIITIAPDGVNVTTMKDILVTITDGQARFRDELTIS
jgi:hypothetical protein